MAHVKERGGGEKERKEMLRQTPGFLKTAYLACHAWVRASTFDAVIGRHNWPIKCLAFRGAEMNFRGSVWNQNNLFFVFWNAWKALMVKSHRKAKDQCGLCTFVYLIRLKGRTTRVKFWSFSSKLPYGFEVVKCDKHSSQVFSIRDAYLYKVKAQLDRTSYRSRHGTEN